MKPKKNVAKYGRLAVLGLGLCTLRFYGWVPKPVGRAFGGSRAIIK